MPPDPARKNLTSTSDPLRPYAPRVAARWLRDSPSERHRAVEGTLVSADISGFTALSERLADLGRGGAEAVVAVVNGCFEEMIGRATTFGGDVLKFGGDALLLLFDGDDHTRRAAVACGALRDVLAAPRSHPVAGEVDLSMSIGLHAGTMHLFLGRGLHAELIVAGRDASRAVACESTARAGDILASHEAADALPGDWLTPFPPDPDAGMLVQPPVDDPALHVPAELVDVDHAALVPPSLARHVVDGGVPGQIRPVTTAFISFSGLDDAIEQTGPRRVARTLQSLVEVVSQATDAFGVHWLDTDIAVDGGKVHLTAGAPTATADDDAAMLTAVRAILDTCVAPPLAAGVNHGVVFVGDVGSPNRRTLAAMGDSVNLAARLSGRAGPGELVAHLDVVEGSGTRFEAEPIEPFRVKGKSRPVLAARVGQPATDAPEPTDDAPVVPLVARTQELDLLLQATDRARDGDPQVVLVQGPNGIGKTRLATELADRLGERLRVLATVCDPHQAATPFSPFRGLLRQVAGIPLDASADAAGARLLGHVAADVPDLAPWAPLLAMPIGATVPMTPEVERIAPAFRRLRLQQAVTDYVRAALPGPALLVLEDIEWLDEASKDLLADLLLGVFDRPWCLVLASHGQHEADTDADLVPLEVGELDDEAMTRLAELALGDHPALPRDVAAMVRAAAGHPLFLLEIVAHVRETGDSSTLPRTVEAAVTSRFDQLDPSDLAVLRELAVLGSVVRRTLAEHVLGAAVDDEDRWERVGAFVSATEDHLAFREDLYQRVAYDGLAFARRRELHALAADALAAVPADTAEWLTARAMHEDRAGRHFAAWEAGVAAGDAMRGMWASAAAADHYELALRNAEQVPTVQGWERASVAERLGDVAELASLNSRAIEAYGIALELESRAVDHARLLRKTARADLNLGEYERGVARLEQALHLLDEETRDHTAPVRASVLEEYGAIRYRQGRLDETIDLTRRAIEEIRDHDPAVAARARFIQASALMQKNDPRAQGLLTLALDTFIETGDLVHQGHCHTNLGLIAFYAGDWERASDHYRSAQQLYGDAGYAKGAAIQCLNFGEIQENQRHWSTAIESFRDAKRRYRAMHAPLGVASADGHLGWIHAMSGDVEGGIALLRESVEAFERLDAGDFLAVSRAQLAQVLARNGHVDEAEAVIDQAEAADPPAQVRSALARGRALVQLARGDRVGARDRLQQAATIAREEGLPFEEATASDLLLEFDLVTGPDEARHRELRDEVWDRLGVLPSGGGGP